jgi:hypothetical protein
MQSFGFECLLFNVENWKSAVEFGLVARLHCGALRLTEVGI